MILCPNCHSEESFVVDSRPNEKGVRRRRECKICCARYSTVELVTIFERGGDRRTACESNGFEYSASEEQQAFVGKVESFSMILPMVGK